MNKKAFISTETFANAGFWILVVLGWSATIIGWKMSSSFGDTQLPMWQILLILVVIFFASAFFARE